MTQHRNSGSPVDRNAKEMRCPRCGRRYKYHSVKEHRHFPFCSQRCRDVDLGNWIVGKYRLPGAPLPPQPEEGDDVLEDTDVT